MPLGCVVADAPDDADNDGICDDVDDLLSAPWTHAASAMGPGAVYSCGCLDICAGRL